MEYSKYIFMLKR